MTTPSRTTARPFALNTLALLAALSLAAQAGAQGAALDLGSAVTRALASGPDTTTSRANLQKAQANDKAVRADPTSIITDQVSAQQGLESAQINLSSTKLTVMQTVVTQYLSIYEAEQREDLNAAQVNYYSRSLQIAQARLAARVATPLDVTKAQNSLSSNQQELADARAQRPIAAAQLAKTLGITQSAVTVKAPAHPAAAQRHAGLAASWPRGPPADAGAGRQRGAVGPASGQGLGQRLHPGPHPARRPDGPE